MNRRRCGQIVAGALLALAAGFVARAAESERFRLVSAETADSLGRRLEALAPRGYRVMATGQGAAMNGKNRIVVLLEHRPESPPVDYHVLETSGDFDESDGARALNDWAADGYRLSPDAFLPKRLEDWWMPETSYEHQLVLILERGQENRTYEYTRVGIGSVAQFERDLAARLAEGYGVVGMWNAGRSLSVVMERTMDADGLLLPPADGVRADDDTYRLLIGVNRISMKGDIERASRQGYGLLDIVDQSITAPPMVLLKRLPPTEEPRVIKLMYNPDKKIYKDKLEKKLNKKGKLGFRVSGRSVTTHVVGLERPGEAPPRMTYRALSSKKVEGLSEVLDQALRDGYGFLALLVSADEIVLVVGKSTDEPAFEL